MSRVPTQVFAVLLFLSASCAHRHPGSAPGRTAGSEGAERSPAAKGSAAPATGSAATAGVPNTATPDLSTSVLSVMDRKADPCQDFYRYACGGWLDATTIPADQPYWGRGNTEIEKRNEEILHDILERAAKDPGNDRDLAKLGGFYGACMDEAAIERAGATPLKPYLAEIGAVRDLGSFLKVAGELHVSGAGPAFAFEVEPDFKNPDAAIAVFDQGGLGLFDRDYYLKDDPQSTALRQAYQSHVARMLALSGEPEEVSKKHAGMVVAFETELAKTSRPRVDLRDPEKNYHKIDIAGLKTLTPQLPWDAFVGGLGYPGIKDLSVGQPEFFEGLGALTARTDAETLQAYLRWNLVHGMANLLSTGFVDENFAFYGAIVEGQKEIKPRWKRCVAATDGALGEMLGKYYVERAFPGDSKAMALDMMKRIESAFETGLPEVPWMDPVTRERALVKLHALTNKIGYPDTWRDYSKLTVDRNDYFASALAGRRFEFKRNADRIGGAVDRTEWGLTPPSVNAYANPLFNEMVFPAGILQPPYFNRAFPAPMNFGGIGMVMGHELTHHYDDEGRKFDTTGRLHEWWDPAASERFEKAASCVEELYSSYEPQPGIKLNGKLTLGENIADLGGVKEAYRAWKRWEAANGSSPPALAGMTNDQLFFVGFAQGWCTLMTPELERLLVNLDPHSPSKYRVIGPLANFPAFGEAFGCKEGTPMRSARTCSVW